MIDNLVIGCKHEQGLERFDVRIQPLGGAAVRIVNDDVLRMAPSELVPLLTAVYVEIKVVKVRQVCSFNLSLSLNPGELLLQQLNIGIRLCQDDAGRISQQDQAERGKIHP